MREIEELAGEKSELLAQIKSLTEEVSGYQNRIRETKSQTNEKQGLPHLSALSFLTSSSSLCLSPLSLLSLLLSVLLLFLSSVSVWPSDPIEGVREEERAPAPLRSEDERDGRRH
jgi:hypothetical protein